MQVSGRLLIYWTLLKLSGELGCNKAVDVGAEGTSLYCIMYPTDICIAVSLRNITTIQSLLITLTSTPLSFQYAYPYSTSVCQCLPPYTAVKQTIWDMSLINTIDDAWFLRGLAITACSTTVNK